MSWRSFLIKMRPRRLVAAMTLFAVAAGGWSWYAGAARKAPAELFVPVAVKNGTIEEVVTALGKLEPKQYVDVGTQVSGQLKVIHVDIGDIVTRGQLLAEIDPRVYQSQVEANEARLNSLQAALQQQEAELTLAEQNLKRNRELIEINAVSRQALEESESQAAVAQAELSAILAQIRETESNLRGSRTNLSFTKIYAPMAGTVTTMPAREGQTLNANQSAPTILQLADLDTMTVRAQVAEADISRLRHGMPVYFTTLGNHERRWDGKVRQILPSPQIVNDVVLYDVLIDVANKDRRLMTGMTAQVFFVFGRAQNAAIIPAEALTARAREQDNDTGKAYRVMVETETGREERLIHVGLQSRTDAQVVAGLQPGDRILLRRPAAAARETERRNARFTRGLVL